MKHLLFSFCFLSLTGMVRCQDSTLANQKTLPDKNKGYSCINELGASFGLALHSNEGGPERYHQVFFSFKTTHGYRFNKNYFLGAGFGTDVTSSKKIPNWGTYKTLMLPIFAEFRATIHPRKVSPFISQSLGYSFYFVFPKPDSYAKVNGGAMAATQIGFSVRIAKRLAYNFSAGYRFQHIAIKWDFSHLTFGAQWDGSGYNALLPSNEYNLPTVTHYFYHYATVMTGITF